MVAGHDGRQGLALLIRGADAGHERRRARPKVRDRGEAGVGLEGLPQARARQSGREDEPRLGPGAISEIPHRLIGLEGPLGLLLATDRGRDDHPLELGETDHAADSVRGLPGGHQQHVTAAQPEPTQLLAQEVPDPAVVALTLITGGHAHRVDPQQLAQTSLEIGHVRGGDVEHLEAHHADAPSLCQELADTGPGDAEPVRDLCLTQVIAVVSGRGAMQHLQIHRRLEHVGTSSPSQLARHLGRTARVPPRAQSAR